MTRRVEADTSASGPDAEAPPRTCPEAVCGSRPGRSMKARLKNTLRVLAALLAVLMIGFVIFMNAVRSLVPNASAAADGIVVLTGPGDRITLGLELLAKGRAQRMLISGVHPSNKTAAELLRRLSGRQVKVPCCVDLGHVAENTIGNAIEAREWALNWGFKSLLIVTAAYHMPRSLAEFSRTMPDVRLEAYPAVGRPREQYLWSLDRHSWRTHASEYLKFLVSSVRLGLGRMLGALIAWPGSRADEPARPHTI